MTDMTSTGLTLPRRSRQDATIQGATGRPDLSSHFARALSWLWRQWRRRELVNTLRRVDDRLLRDVGIEPCDVEQVVDDLIARRR